MGSLPYEYCMRGVFPTTIFKALKEEAQTRYIQLEVSLLAFGHEHKEWNRWEIDARTQRITNDQRDMGMDYKSWNRSFTSLFSIEDNISKLSFSTLVISELNSVSVDLSRWWLNKRNEKEKPKKWQRKLLFKQRQFSWKIYGTTGLIINYLSTVRSLQKVFNPAHNSTISHYNRSVPLQTEVYEIHHSRNVRRQTSQGQQKQDSPLQFIFI